jgi:hypothetical protein
MTAHPTGAVERATAKPKSKVPGDDAATSLSRLTTADVWREVRRHSFAVIAHVTASGEPRSSGVVYGVDGRRLYIVVAPDSWKARQLATGDEVSVTVPVRRGGLLALLFPIPPATISFHATATVHPPGTLDVSAVSKDLAKLLPDARHATAGSVIEITPVGQFLLYGLGVSLSQMRDPVLARGHVPVG